MSCSSSGPTGDSLGIRLLRSAETEAAAAVLSRGMRDNPLHVSAFGRIPERRETTLRLLFERLLQQYLAKGAILGAFSTEVLVGVCALVEPGRCRPTPREKLALVLPLLAGAGAGGTLRALRWNAAWSRRDPAVAHWHIGPVGVEPRLQGRGIGGALLRECCARVDTTRSTAYLETDKRENLPFTSASATA